MRTTKISGHLHQLSYYAGFGNCFLVREDDGFTVVDTAVKGQGKAILQAAQALGLPIRRILLTHSHVDHAGSVDELHAALPEVPFILGAREVRLMRGDMSLDPGEPQTKIGGGFPPVSAEPTQLIREGDTVGSLQVIASPGHTPGHLSFFDPRDGTLIAGDAFQTRGGVAVSGTLELLFPFPAFATWNKPTALASAKKLLALGLTVLTVGHGAALRNPQAKMQRAIDVMERALQKGD